MKTATVVLRLYSDFICPFCYIAEHSTVARLVREYDVTVDWRGFELHPGIPAGGMALSALLPGRDVEAMHDHVVAYAKTFGVDLPRPPLHVPNTRMALAVAEYARDHGKLDAFRHAAMVAHWRDHLDLESASTLKAAATAAGLDGAAAVKAATDPAFLARVDAMRAEAEDAGVSGIPTMIFHGGHVVVGAQAWEVVRAQAIAAGAHLRQPTPARHR